MKTYRLADNLSLIDVAPPISGFEKFLGIYVLEAGKIALIDVGPSAAVKNLMSGLRELKVNPADISYILVTHIHMDHAGGIGQVIAQMPNARVVVHERGAPHLIDPKRLWEDSQRALGQLALDYGPIAPVAQDKIVIAESGMVIDLDGMAIEVLDTPGHAPHHLSFLERKEGRLFAGEAAGVYNAEVDLVRATAPPPFNLERAITSVDKLVSLAPTSLCYAHFGCATRAVDRLNGYKQQLILWGKIIADCREKGADSQGMYNEIREKDTNLVRLDGLPSDQRDRELYFVNNAIAGFVGYFERYGSDYIKQL